MQNTKAVTVYEGSVPNIDDAMAIIHKMPYLELQSLAALLSADADKMAEAAESYQIDWNREREERERAAKATPPAAPWPSPIPTQSR